MATISKKNIFPLEFGKNNGSLKDLSDFFLGREVTGFCAHQLFGNITVDAVSLRAGGIVTERNIL